MTEGVFKEMKGSYLWDRDENERNGTDETSREGLERQIEFYLMEIEEHYKTQEMSRVKHLGAG